MQYAQRSSQPVCTRSVYAVRPATPGAIGEPHGPSPSPDGSAVIRSSSRARLPTRASLVWFGTTRSTFGSEATSAGRRVA